MTCHNSVLFPFRYSLNVLSFPLPPAPFLLSLPVGCQELEDDLDTLDLFRILFMVVTAVNCELQRDGEGKRCVMFSRSAIAALSQFLLPPVYA